MILAEARDRILSGHTVEQIAVSNGISSRTLHYWLSALGDEYKALRQAWIDEMLFETGKAIEDARDFLQLARAREGWKHATWYAERLDPRYRPQQQVAVNTAVQVVISKVE